MTRLPWASAAPRVRICRSGADPSATRDLAAIPGANVDLVEHVPGIGDVEESVFHQRGGVGEAELLALPPSGNCIDKLEVLDVIAVDAGERREPLAVIGAAGGSSASSAARSGLRSRVRLARRPPRRAGGASAVPARIVLADQRMGGGGGGGGGGGAMYHVGSPRWWFDFLPVPGMTNFGIVLPNLCAGGKARSFAVPSSAAYVFANASPPPPPRKRGES